MNLDFSQSLIKSLVEIGVKDFIVCAGARNAPILKALSKFRSTGLYSVAEFFDERSASFFALGKLKSSPQDLVAVITTSGTAVAELLPATCEAYHSGLPLLLVSADRPTNLRYTGAPQTMNQVGVLKDFCESVLDLDVSANQKTAEPDLKQALGIWTQKKPLHINVCFDEPLLSGELCDANEFMSSLKQVQDTSLSNSSLPSEDFKNQILKFKSSKTVVLVGGLSEFVNLKSMVRFLKFLGAPVYLESTSGIRGSAELAHLELKSGEGFLDKLWSSNQVEAWIRIGSIPTCKVWRRLEKPTVPVISLSDLPFSGISGTGTDFNLMFYAGVDATLDLFFEQDLFKLPHPLVDNVWCEDVLNRDHKNVECLTKLLSREPQSEPAMICALSHLVRGDLVYVGNSLPIREWDFCSMREPGMARAHASRGLNGIDGQISTFLGLLSRCSPETQGSCVVGDLTALYDLNALWALRYLTSQQKLTIFVVNNSGGMIFKKIFDDRIFENNHEMGFEHWAKMWNIGYHRWTEIPKSKDFESPVTVVEICPDNVSTERFWKSYESNS